MTQYMEYEDFLTKMKDLLSEMLSEKHPVVIKYSDFLRNNNVIRKELQINSTDDPCGKVMDPRPLYDRYLMGSEIEQLAQEVIDIYLQEESSNITEICRGVDHYESIRERIFIRVVNYHENQLFLSLCPHVQKLDLAMTFRIRVQDSDRGLLSMSVDNFLFERWNISLEQLYEDALVNTRRIFPEAVVPIRVLLDAGLSGTSIADLVTDEVAQEMESDQMYAITNDQSINGAVAVFYPNVLRELADRLGSDIYLMPSSIHEMMAVPCEKWDDVSQLKTIVEDANQSVVAKEEQLGSSVYKYERRTDEITIAA